MCLILKRIDPRARGSRSGLSIGIANSSWKVRNQKIVKKGTFIIGIINVMRRRNQKYKWHWTSLILQMKYMAKRK